MDTTESGPYAGQFHEHPRVRELLLARAIAFVREYSGIAHPELHNCAIRWLCSDLDTLTRLIAALKGWRESCWGDGLGAPWLRRPHLSWRMDSPQGHLANFHEPSVMEMDNAVSGISEIPADRPEEAAEAILRQMLGAGS